MTGHMSFVQEQLFNLFFFLIIQHLALSVELKEGFFLLLLLSKSSLADARNKQVFIQPHQESVLSTIKTFKGCFSIWQLHLTAFFVLRTDQHVSERSKQACTKIRINKCCSTGIGDRLPLPAVFCTGPGESCQIAFIQWFGHISDTV